MNHIKEIYLITIRNSAEEIKQAEEKLHNNTASLSATRLFNYLHRYSYLMYDLNNHQTLFISSKGQLLSFILLIDKLGLNPIFRTVTDDVLCGKLYHSVLSSDFLSLIEKHFEPVPRLDDVLDKILKCGLLSLSKLEIAVLKSS